MFMTLGSRWSLERKQTRCEGPYGTCCAVWTLPWGRFLSRKGNAQIWVAKLGLAARWGLACWEKEGGREICRREWWPGSGGGSGDGEKGTDLRLVEGNGQGLGLGGL